MIEQDVRGVYSSIVLALYIFTSSFGLICDHIKNEINQHRRNTQECGHVPILRVSANSAKPLDHTYPCAYAPKNCVLVIKEWCWSEGDEELGALNLQFNPSASVRRDITVWNAWIPFVFGPAFAMARIPAPTNRSSGWISSSLMRTSLACTCR